MTVSVGTGDLLIAPPNMLDSRFASTVMLITAHEEDMSMALCLNKVTEHTLSDILEPINLTLDQDPEIYWGGPVASNTVWMLHDDSWSTENTVYINSDWAVTSHYEMFNIIAKIGWPEQYRIMFGHCAWAQGQLEGELSGKEPWDHNHSWLVANKPTPEWLLGCDASRMWSLATNYCSHQAVGSWMN